VDNGTISIDDDGCKMAFQHSYSFVQSLGFIE